MFASGKWRATRAQLCRLPLVVVCAAVPLLSAGPAEALSPSCREIVLSGAAGVDFLDDKVVFRVVKPSGALISESCEFTVRDRESAVDFLRRIPRQWGTGQGGLPASDPQCRSVCSAGQIGIPCGQDSDCDVAFGDGSGLCGIETKKSCTSTDPNPANNQPSCRVQVKISQKSGTCYNTSMPANSSLDSCKRDRDCPAGEVCPTHPDNSGRVRACSELDPLLDGGETCLKKPAVLRVCCKESPLCAGSSLGTTQPSDLATTVQTKLNPPGSEGCDGQSPFFCPGVDELPSPGSELRTIVLDPISAVTTPYKAVADCREAIADAEAELATVVVDTLISCHEIGAPSVDCNSVNPQSDADGDIAETEADLRAAVTAECAASGSSPASFGYRSCPQPCASVAVGTCSAGSVGSPCQNDADCDVLPGDGTCGDWNTLSDCLICQASNASVQTILALYNPAPPALVLPQAGGPVGPQALPDAAALACRQAIANAVSSRLKLNLDETNRCQKKIDAAKLLLRDGAPKCRDADTKGKRALADTVAAAALQLACPPSALGQLNTCSSNLAGLKACTRAAVKRATDRVAEAASPEQVCGDGKLGIGEKCDDGNLTDGDGCDSNCAPTGCGNKVQTAGEECDDGNTTAGDGCDAACIAELVPCGAQTCSTYTFDCSSLFPGQCVCLQSAEGPGSCVNNFNCTTAQDCVQTSNCPPGNICYVNTCCGVGKCGPPTCTGAAN